jgi:hypothetical protein
VQTLAVANVFLCRFPAGVSTVVSTFGFLPRNSSGINMCRGASKSCQGCCGGLWIATGGGLCIVSGSFLWKRLCVCNACHEATWRESLSIRSSNPAVLSGIAGGCLLW